MIRPNGARVVFYDFSDTTDPKCLAVGAVDYVSYRLDPDEDGASTGILVQPYFCSEKTLNTDHCTKILNDTDGDGVLNDLPLDGATIGRRGKTEVYVTDPNLCFDIEANPNSDDGRITVKGG